jgi:HAD superfamily hydrolase (TIGR01509 family)
MIRAVVFDFNGTLFHDMDLHEQVWRDVVRQYTGREMSEDEFHHNFVGRTNLEIWPRLLGHNLTAAEAHERSEVKEAAYRQLVLNRPERLHLVDGAIELFELLGQQGVEIAIGTAAGRSNVEFYIEHLHLHRWFPAERIVYDDGTMPGKPHPALFATAMARTGVAPGECLVVEDGVLGVQSAQAAGAAKVYGIWTDVAGRDKLSAAGVHRLIQSYREMGLDDLR